MDSAWRAGGAIAAVIALTVFGAQVLLHRAARRAALAARRDDLPSAAGAMCSIVRETALTLCFALPTPWPRFVDDRSAGNARIVVLVHGFGTTAISMWPLARRLRRDGWSVAAPAIGPWWRDLGSAAARLASHLDRLQHGRSVGELVVVAHGLGGLATRLALTRVPRLASGLRLLVTLGTPHDGTEACPALRVGPWNDIRPGSPAVRALRATPLPPGVEAIAIASPDDALVVPPERARWSEACNVSVAGHGHLSLLVSPTVREIVAENLAALEPPAVAGHAG